MGRPNLFRIFVVLRERSSSINFSYHMKKFFYSIAITVFLTANLHAQTGTWGVVVTPAGLLNGYDQMIFPTDTIGYIYGATTISPHDMEQTTDTGADFNPVTIKTTLRSPFFGSSMAWPTAQNGYITADTGHYPANGIFFLSTSNAGSSWTTSRINPNWPFQSIDFPTPIRRIHATGSQHS